MVAKSTKHDIDIGYFEKLNFFTSFFKNISKEIRNFDYKYSKEKLNIA